MGETIARMGRKANIYSNNNKLLVHMYIVKNTTIFLMVRLLLIRYNYMFRPSMLAIFRLPATHPRALCYRLVKTSARDRSIIVHSF